MAGDVYDAFFKAVGAPSWHGRNFNALRDSIYTGEINEIETPYIIRIANYGSIGPNAKSIARDFVELIQELKKAGCSVDIQVDG